MLNAAVGKVEVIGLCRIFSGQGIDLFHRGQYAQFFSVISYLKQVLLVHLVFPQGPGQLEIGESQHFGFDQKLFVQAYVFPVQRRIQGFELLGGTHDFEQLLQKPGVNFGELVYLFHGIAGPESFADDKDASVGGFAQGLVDVRNLQFFVFDKTVHALTYHAQALLDGFFEGSAYGHYFAHRFHAAAQLTGYALKLTQIPAGDFADYVIQGRFKKGGSGFGNRIFEFK